MRAAHLRKNVLVALTLAIAAAARGQAQLPNFAGHWRLDAAASSQSGGGRGDGSGRASGGGGGGGGGIGLGPAASELTIRQDDSTLTINELGSGDTAPVRYRLDGKRTKNKLIVGRGTIADVTFSSRWNDRQLATTIVREIPGRGRSTTVRYRELMYLAADGALVIETNVQGRPEGRKSVYRAVAP